MHEKSNAGTSEGQTVIKLIEKKDGDSFKTEDPFHCWT